MDCVCVWKKRTNNSGMCGSFFGYNVESIIGKKFIIFFNRI